MPSCLQECCLTLQGRTLSYQIALMSHHPACHLRHKLSVDFLPPCLAYYAQLNRMRSPSPFKPMGQGPMDTSAQAMHRREMLQLLPGGPGGNQPSKLLPGGAIGSSRRGGCCLTCWCDMLGCFQTGCVLNKKAKKCKKIDFVPCTCTRVHTNACFHHTTSLCCVAPFCRFWHDVSTQPVTRFLAGRLQTCMVLVM